MKRLVAAIALLVCTLPMWGQKIITRDYAQFGRYEEADIMLAAQPDPGRVVIMGDSITDNWARMRPGFFAGNGIIGRGISGQTTPQMLLRFRRDVIETHAAAVAILAGTNDIAGNNGPTPLQEIVDNIASMCDLAKANGVRPIICSVLPAHRYPWSPEMRPDIHIPALNEMLKKLAADNDITYVDFFAEMVDSNPENGNGLPRKLAGDGVHPTNEGYEIMERMLLDNLKDEMATRAAVHAGKEIKLASYNIRNCNGMDRTRSYIRVGEVIHSFGADAVALQEVDLGTGRNEGDDIAAILARMTGKVPTFAKAIDIDKGWYGVAMLTDELPMRTKRVPLPGREEQRVLLMAELSDYIFCCTHLSLVEEDRLASVDIINKEVEEFAKGTGKPVFISGDWNDHPGSATINKISENFKILNSLEEPTFPADDPQKTIDFIARWKGSPKGELDKVAEAGVPVVPTASDHRPVTVILK